MTGLERFTSRSARLIVTREIGRGYCVVAVSGRIIRVVSAVEHRPRFLVQSFNFL